MPNHIDLSGKIAFITGASRGIGAEVAKNYAAAGAHVVLAARSVGGLEQVDDDIRGAGGQATLMPIDLLKLDELDHLGPTLLERFGQLDIFVGNAGLLGTLGPLAHADPKEWQKIYDLNVTANFRLIRTLDPLLRAAPAGRVILVSSGASKRPKAYWAAYRSSKAAVDIMAQSYADEMKNTPVKVNIIHPGAINTAMLETAYPGGYPDNDNRDVQDIMPAFLELAADACQRHGEIVVPA